MATLLENLRAISGFTILSLGNTRLTLGSVAQLAILFAVLLLTSRWLGLWISMLLGRRTAMTPERRAATAVFLRYGVIAIGTIAILQSAGIDLSSISILLGTLGVGIGFGLQSLANNFISGLVILFEKPVKIGDRIEVGGVEGKVISIAARSTTVLTNDNISVIVPNSRLVSENVVNWSHNDRSVRFHVPVGVAYGSDLREVERILLAVARENPDVLDDPAPVVRLVGFGDSGVNFELRVWSLSLVDRKGALFSGLNFAIYEKFQTHGIEIPFPQRDLHIRSTGEVPSTFSPNG